MYILDFVMSTEAVRIVVLNWVNSDIPSINLYISVFQILGCFKHKLGANFARQ